MSWAAYPFHKHINSLHLCNIASLTRNVKPYIGRKLLTALISSSFISPIPNAILTVFDKCLMSMEISSSTTLSSFNKDLLHLLTSSQGCETKKQAMNHYD
jgi:hypothetical protein